MQSRAYGSIVGSAGFSMLLLLATLSPFVHASTQSAHVPTFADVPPPPQAVGCYQYSYDDKSWVSVTCQEVTNAPPPTIGSGSTVYGLSTSSSNANFGYIWLDLHQYTSPESDSCFGANSYGVQVNTNTFTGSNGDNDWVQFTIQEGQNSGCGYSAIQSGCIWQIDLTTGSYNSGTCVSIPAVNPSSSFYASVQGNTTSGGHLQAEYMLCGSTCNFYSRTESDSYGLAGNWNTVTASMLGVGDSSTASFTSSTNSYQDIKIGAPSLTSATSIGVSGLTGESSNLSYYWSSYIGCTGGECLRDTGASI